ncbi:MAG: hypothetical protein OQJ97_14265 [Rhodospirillales bacterium]|nr:hypothetical protein [Rhodospirillales bacterium]
MSHPTKVLSVRVTQEDIALFQQAADGQGLDSPDWMRAALRKTALDQVYGGSNPFPSNLGETALLRAVLVILQLVGGDTPEETKNIYVKKAARQIEKIKAGDWS